MRRALDPTAVPRSPFYSQGVELSGPQRLVYVSGQVGIGGDGEPLEGIEQQTRQAVKNLEAVLGEAELTPADIAKMTIYLTQADHVGAFMAAAGDTLPEVPPATTLLVVQSLADPRLLVEIEAVAAA